MHELTELNMDRARSLFLKIEEFDLSITSVFEGHYFGRIFVDDVFNPKSGFLELGKRTLILAGEENNQFFNSFVEEQIFSRILPVRMKDYKFKEFYIIFENNWRDTIPKIYPKSRIHTRKYYTFKELVIPNWKIKLPDDYSINLVDKAFLEKDIEDSSNLLRNWITDLYGSEDNYLSRGIGFCLVYQDKEIASYNLVNYIDDKRERAEMGIVTKDNFQRKGLSKLLVSACLEYCLKEGIKEIGWHTSSQNIASQRTAESVGFVLDRDYDIFQGSYE